jgi:hypothetical protein
MDQDKRLALSAQFLDDRLFHRFLLLASFSDWSEGAHQGPVPWMGGCASGPVITAIP